MRIFTITLLGCFCVIFSIPCYGMNFATQYRLSDHENHVRFVVECQNEPHFELTTLTLPDRLVIDLKKTILQVLPPDASMSSKYIKNIRHSMHNPEDARLVLDLHFPVLVSKTHILKPTHPGENYRLIIDMESILPPLPPVQHVSIPQAPVVKKLKNIHEKAENASKAKTYRRPIIILDPGHGGKDSGAIGRYRKVYEKHITLTYAKALKEELEKNMDCEVYLTRGHDIYIPLHDRVKIGRKHHGDLMISIHADSHPNPATKGLSIYTLSEKASDKEAEALAGRENKRDIIHNVDFSNKSHDLTSVLIDLVQRESKNKSADFAEFVVKELEQKVYFLQNTHRFAGFRVLKGSDIPSVLIELGYLSNREEEKQLMNPVYRTKIITALSRAIYHHFSKHKPIG